MRGVTIACLNSSGNTHERRDIFTSSVIGVIRISRQSLTKKVGQGSREQDLVGLAVIILRTSSVDTFSNAENLGMTL